MKEHVDRLPAGSAERQRLEATDHLLTSYIRTHRAEVVAEWPRAQLCSAQFIVSHFFCRDAGNNLGTWLDNMAWAVILNRTIVVHWMGRASLCHGAVEVQPWVLTTARLATLRQRMSCPAPLVDVRLRGTHTAIGCCDVERANTTYFNPGRVYKLAYQKLRPVDGKTNLRDPSARGRAATLFSNPRGMASYEAYGLLTLHTLHFTRVVTNLTSAVLPPPVRTPTVVVGVQARHQKRDQQFEASVDGGFQRCLRHYLTKLVVASPTHNRTCTVLIATDRITALKKLKATAAEFGCTPTAVKRLMKESTREHRGEHGPWGESVTSMTDFYLLAHHAQYFLGTKISSFSALMLNVIVARAALQGRTDPVAWGVHVEKVLKRSDPTGAGAGGVPGLSYTLPVTSEEEALPCAEYRDSPELGYMQDLPTCDVDHPGVGDPAACMHTFSTTSYGAPKHH